MKLEMLHTSVIVIDCAHFIKIVVLITGQGKFKVIVFVISEKIAKNHRNTTGCGSGREGSWWGGGGRGRAPNVSSSKRKK